MPIDLSPASDFDAYATLGVPKIATADEIKRAYRDLMRAWHPDVNTDAAAHDRAVLVNVAYELLSDPALRADYDNPRAGTPKWRAWYHERVRIYNTANCLRCGKRMYAQFFDDGRPYVPADRHRRIDATYCSNACRQAAYRERKAAAAMEDERARAKAEQERRRNTRRLGDG
jgi:DnaJ-class molecular chaperone